MGGKSSKRQGYTFSQNPQQQVASQQPYAFPPSVTYPSTYSTAPLAAPMLSSGSMSALPPSGGFSSWAPTTTTYTLPPTIQGQFGGMSNFPQPLSAPNAPTYTTPPMSYPSFDPTSAGGMGYSGSGGGLGYSGSGGMGYSDMSGPMVSDPSYGGGISSPFYPSFPTGFPQLYPGIV